ncbi:Zinc finger, CCHC domain-containing protein [Modicella reniformis]|uniref:polynucleotide adenylyltransferase n=1 Tax=Modicella reniformis TaxID=1440133 RepID=A0A9P6M2W5_9FUNG|nr:Zinc finger, CCHC domain-containing protein [Modicella reniformis]
MHERHHGIFSVWTAGAGTNDDDRPENSSSSSKKWAVIRSGRHLMVPDIGPKDIEGRIRNHCHLNTPENYKTMIASIVCKLRMTLWKGILPTLQTDVGMKEVGVQNDPKLPPQNGVQPLMYSNTDRVAQKLKGLKIKTKDLVPKQDYMDKRTDLIRRLEEILNEGFPGYKLRLEVFGSFVSGLGSQSSDVNLCMASSEFQASAPYNNMTRVAQVFGSAGMTNILPISTARVPNVKFCDPKTNIQCEINSNHVLGIYNSEMIRCYTLIDDRVKPFIYNLKALVKKHNIQDSGIDYLSRYCYVMMAIGFLQAQEPPILPALQAQPKEYMTPCRILLEHTGKEEGVIDCTYDRDPTRHRDFGAANRKSIGQLLIEFFEFYSRYFDYQTMEVNIRLGGGVRVRDEITLARAKGDVKNIPRNGEGVKKLVVMDPFLRDQNIAEGCKPFNLARIWGIFEDLYLTLSFGVFQPIPNVLEAGRKEWEEEQEKDQLAPNIEKTRQEKRRGKRPGKKARMEKKAKEEQEKKAKEEQEKKVKEEQEMKEQEMKEMKEQEMKEMKEQEMKEMKEQEMKAKEAVALAAASAAAASSSSPSSSSNVASPATVVGSLKAQQALTITEEVKSAVSIPVQSTAKGKVTVASGTASVPAIVPNSNGVPKLVRWQEPLEEVRQKNHQKHPRRPRRPRQNKQRLREQQQQQQQQEQQQQQQDQQQQQEQQQQHEQQRQQEQEQQQQQEQQRQQEQQQLEEAQRKKHKNHLRKLRRQHNKQMGLLQEQQQEQQQQQQQQQQNQQQQKQKQQKPMSRERSQWWSWIGCSTPS